MPYTDQNHNTRPVLLGELERLIVRNALKTHRDALLSAKKRDSGLGTPNPTIDLHLVVIDGGTGWGQSLHGKFDEQGSFSEQDHADHADAVRQADLMRDAEDYQRTVETLRAIGLDLDHQLFVPLTYTQRAEIRNWANALVQLHTREDGKWVAVDPAPEGVELQPLPLFFFDLLAPIAALEREAEIGEIVALRDALAMAKVVVPLTAFATRTPEELTEVRAWLDRWAPAVVAYDADPSDENSAACDAIEAEIPKWLDEASVAAETDEEDGDEQDEEDGDDWTAQPGELRQPVEAASEGAAS